jgi:hypothetical protein
MGALHSKALLLLLKKRDRLFVGICKTTVGIEYLIKKLVKSV